MCCKLPQPQTGDASAWGAWRGRSSSPPPPPVALGAEWGVKESLATSGFSSSGEGVPWLTPGTRLKVRPRRGKARAWRPGRRNRASCGCNLLAQRPQGHVQANCLLVAASPKDVQTPRPANGRRTRDAPTDAPSTVCRQRY